MFVCGACVREGEIWSGRGGRRRPGAEAPPLAPPRRPPHLTLCQARDGNTPLNQYYTYIIYDVWASVCVCVTRACVFRTFPRAGPRLDLRGYSITLWHVRNFGYFEY